MNSVNTGKQVIRLLLCSTILISSSLSRQRLSFHSDLTEAELSAAKQISQLNLPQQNQLKVKILGKFSSDRWQVINQHASNLIDSKSKSQSPEPPPSTNKQKNKKRKRNQITELSTLQPGKTKHQLYVEENLENVSREERNRSAWLAFKCEFCSIDQETSVEKWTAPQDIQSWVYSIYKDIYNSEVMTLMVQHIQQQLRNT